MAEVEIRPAVSSDIPVLEKFDHTIETTHVWQVDNTLTKEHISIQMSEVRLPRILRLNYPRRAESLKDTWTHHLLFLVARCDGNLVGYLILDENRDLLSAVVHDLVVTMPMRRQGIATALILAAQDWVKKRGMTRLVIELPAKNHAMIELARKLRFVFAGAIDNFYANRDMAFFFVNQLK